MKNAAKNGKVMKSELQKIIATDQAPAAVGPYSQAVQIDRFVFTSGQLPLDPAAGKLSPGA